MAYRGVTETSEPKRIGHEFVGVVDDVGADVSSLEVGDVVIAPFALSDNTCVHCRYGVHTSCERGAWWGGQDEHGLPIDAGAPARPWWWPATAPWVCAPSWRRAGWVPSG